MTTAFGRWLAEAVEGTYDSREAFAIAVSLHKATLSNIINGKRTPSLDRVPQWLKALGLKEGSQEWRRANRLAAIAHLPADAQPEFVRIIDELESLRADLRDLELRACDGDRDSQSGAGDRTSQ